MNKARPGRIYIDCQRALPWTYAPAYSTAVQVMITGIFFLFLLRKTLHTEFFFFYEVFAS